MVVNMKCLRPKTYLTNVAIPSYDGIWIVNGWTQFPEKWLLILLIGQIDLVI